jgi:hypothetical protein
LIYDYSDGKDGIFDAVIDDYIERVIDATPIDAHEVPDHAGRLFNVRTSTSADRCESPCARASVRPRPSDSDGQWLPRIAPMAVAVAKSGSLIHTDTASTRGFV